MDSHEILQTMKLNTMMNFKTGDPITDLIISLVFTSCAGALFNYMVNIFDYININSIIKFWKGSMANEITIEVLNIEASDIEALTIEIPKQDNIEVKGPNKIVVGDLDSNEYTTAEFEASVLLNKEINLD